MSGQDQSNNLPPPGNPSSPSAPGGIGGGGKPLDVDKKGWATAGVTGSQTVSMNKRYRDGLAIFKSRCTDYEVVNGFIGELFQNDPFGVKRALGTKPRGQICDIGCGDGTVTLQLAVNALNSTGGEIILDVVEPSEEYLSLTAQKLSALGEPRLKVNYFKRGAEDYFTGTSAMYDFVFSSHSVYFFRIETIRRIYPTINQSGYLVVVAMSRQSIMAELKDMFSPKPTITADDVLDFVDVSGNGFSRPVAVYSRPSVLTLSGISFTERKDDLTEESKNLLSLMIQKDIDDLADPQYAMARNAILKRAVGDQLVLDNSGLVLIKQ